MYNFVQIDADGFKAIQTAWMGFVGENPNTVSLSFYEAILDSCLKHVDGSAKVGDNASAVYGVVPKEGGGVAVALVSVVHARPKSESPYLKLLSVYVEPQLNLADQEPMYEKLAWIAATAIMGSLALSYEKMPAKEVKVWANVPMTKEFLVAISTALLKDASELFEVTSHGNWLVLKKK